MLVAWFVGFLVGLVLGCLVVWLVSWFVCWSVCRFVGATRKRRVAGERDDKGYHVICLLLDLAPSGRQAMCNATVSQYYLKTQLNPKPD